MKHSRRRIWRALIAIALTFVAAISVLLALAWRGIGAAPAGARWRRMTASARHDGERFVNPQPLWNDTSAWLDMEMSDHGVPNAPLPVRKDTEARLAKPAGALRLTWFGHSTVLIEMGETRILTDPVFGPRSSPLSWIGPERWYAPPAALHTLRNVDAVLISHDHYDHLDHTTIEKMAAWDTQFVAPLGVGAHLEYWGIEPKRIVEVDWWDEVTVGPLQVVATPARHASGRQLLDQDRTLWAGYAILGPERRVMFSGDTGLFDAMATIGERLGPFDVVMIEVGAYHRAWPDWHIGPEQAMVAHRMMRGRRFFPIHWGLFNLAPHGWTEPIERTWAAARTAQVELITPVPGEVIDGDAPPPPRRWWPDVPWQTAEEHPIVATRRGEPQDRYPTPDLAALAEIETP